MFDLKFMMSLLLPTIAPIVITVLLNRSADLSKLPKDIRKKLNSNSKKLNNTDREILFKILKVKPISNEAIKCLYKNRENPIQSIIWFSQLENKYVKFQDN